MSEDSEPEAQVVLFIFVGMIFGFLLKFISNWTHLSFTPLMLCIGIIVGAFDIFGNISISVNIISKITSHGFLIIFLPILLFDSAYNVNFFLFKNCLWKVFILVGPGVIFSALAFSIVIKPILGYDDEIFTWTGAIAFGSILATTDPVAVVALLKILGAPAGLSTLIEMESLINDGTGSVLFVLFFNIMVGEEATASKIAKDIFLLIIASPLLGFAFAFGTHLLHKIAFRDFNNLVNLIFFSIYILFYVGDDLHLGTSGIFASVFYGIALGSLSKAHFRDEKEHVIHIILSFCQYVCETLIFYFTGVLIGVRLQSLDSTSLTGEDWGKMFGLYLAMNIIRFIMVVGSLPLQNLYGMKVSLKEALVISYAGLRGALSLILSIIVANDGTVAKATGDRFIFLVGGVVFLSLVINGNTASIIIKSLKIIEKPEIKIRLQEKFIHRISQKSFQEMQNLQSDRFFKVTDWSQVNDTIKDQLFKKELEKIKNERLQMIDQNVFDENTKHDSKEKSFIMILKKKEKSEVLSKETVFKEYRIRFLTLLKNSLREGYDKYTISRKGYKKFDIAIEFELSSVNTPLSIWNNLLQIFPNVKTIQFALSLRKYRILNFFANQYLFTELELIYEITSIFLVLAPEALQNMDTIVGEFLTTEENADFNKFSQEVFANIELAEFSLSNIEENFHDLIIQVQTKRASIILLHEQKIMVEENFKQGYLEFRDYELFMSRIEVKLDHLEKKVLNFKLPQEIDYISNCPEFSLLKREEIGAIKGNTQKVIFEKGTYISEIGVPCFHVYLILSGLVEIFVSDKNGKNLSVTRSMGSLILLPNLIDPQHPSIINALALKKTKMIQIPISVLRKIFSDNLNFKKTCYQISVIYFVKLNHETSLPASLWTEHKIISLSFNTSLKCLEPGSSIIISQGAFLYVGTLIIPTSQADGSDSKKHSDLKLDSVNFSSFSFIPPFNKCYRAETLCELLIIEEKVNEDSKEDHGKLFRKRAMSFINLDHKKKMSFKLRSGSIYLQSNKEIDDLNFDLENLETLPIRRKENTETENFIENDKVLEIK